MRPSGAEMTLTTDHPAVAPAKPPDQAGLLAGITCPDDVRRLPADDLPALAAEIRAELVD